MDILVQLGIVAGALSAIVIFIGMMWKMIRLLSKIVEEVVGAPNVPSLRQDIAALRVELQEHAATWHGGRARERANGGRS